MDEKRLDLWDRATVIEMAAFPDKAIEMKEIIRLARLGLWAREHGVPALQRIEDLSPLRERERREITRGAREALPKDKP